MSRPLRLAGMSLLALAGAVVALTFLVLTVLPQTGLYATYIVLSDSMQPAISIGSVVIVTPEDPASLRPGDVISYTSAQPPYPTITHRIVRISRDPDGRLTFKTKGDYNLVEDSWDVHYVNQAGRVVLAVPLAGYVMAGASTLAGRTVLGILLAALLAVFWLRAIWARPARPQPLTMAAVVVEPERPVSGMRVAMVLWLAVWVISGELWRTA